MTQPHVSAADRPLDRPIGLKIGAALVGALAVALAAQVSLPVPGSPVPFTLQPLAVLIVGGLLGPRFGALALVGYLAMGVAGLPVFTPGGLPGAARLAGPTGGYLIAYPLAAAAVGLLARGGWRLDPSGRRPALAGVLAATVVGLALIHAGGAAQLTVITGSARAAFAAGLAPFLLADGVKALLASLVIRRYIQSTRALT